MNTTFRNISLVVVMMGTLVFFGNCSGGHKKKIAKIDSLIVEVEKSAELLKAINYDTISHLNSVFKATNSDIARVTVIRPTPDEMVVFEMFGQCKKPFRKYLESKANSEQELDYTKKQLESLKESISSNQIPKDSIDSYLMIEEASALDITIEVNKMVEKLNAHRVKFDTLLPKVRLIVAGLDNQIQSNPKLKK